MLCLGDCYCLITIEMQTSFICVYVEAKGILIRPKYHSYLSDNTLTKNFCENADVPCSSLAAVHMMSLQTLK